MICPYETEYQRGYTLAGGGMTVEPHFPVPVITEPELLIGPLAHIKHHSAFGFDYYTVDFNRPGALERFKAEETSWWLHHWDKDQCR